MGYYNSILNKLNQFTKRYYTKMLVKGILLFSILGAVFFFIVLGVEYFLWLGSTGRLILLLLFIAVELFLLYKYIATPLFYLFRLKKGMSNKQASLLIGKHFSEVGDKLYNLLDLSEDKEQSELLLASIEQRSEKLNPVPFVKAVDFKENLKYAKYLIIPFLLFTLIWMSGNLSSFFGSYKRVVNYDMAYEPPAPFSFKLLTNELKVLDSESYTILVTTLGDVRPDVVFITVGGKKLLMQRQENGFQYTFTPPLVSTDFYFSANDIKSRNYHLTALKTPSIQNFEMVLNYPNYTNRPTEILKGTGNATFPEGTNVKWRIKGQNTKTIHLITNDTVQEFNEAADTFEFSRRVYSDLSYQLATSNTNVKHYEMLDYAFEVIGDEYPKIRAKQVLDSLNPNISYYAGEASDDYRISSIRLVCYPNNDPDTKQIVPLTTPNSNFEQFYYTFPSGLDLVDGVNYSFYFEATDNDAIHKGKTSKSQVFALSILDEDQLMNKQLEFQESILDNMDRSLERMKEQKEALRDINKEQKEKSSLNFSDQNQVKDFLKKQKQQENLMQKFSKQLKENLEKGEKDDQLSQLLKERLERQELEAKKNEKLLEELQKMADKIDKEELAKRLEELGKKQQNSERNLEQLLELTKRYYVTEKAAQLSRDLEKLAEKQDEEAEKKGEDKTKEEQEKLNKEFMELSEEMEGLKEDNADLKKPLKLDLGEEKQELIKEDQRSASEELERKDSESNDSEKMNQAEQSASQKQKSAAQKMKELSEQLRQSSSAAGGDSGVTEDAEMLRQILDNLITFSFKQENLFDTLKEADENLSHFSGSVRKQQELKGLFEHVDDSLFALSLRRAELSEFVNEQITEVYYNIDKTLESMAESRLYQGVSYQKYVLNASNGLADFLAGILDNMQQSMQMGQGQSGNNERGFQLPDIIKSQEELQRKMEQMGQSGQGQPNQGQQGKEGQQGQGEKSGQGEQSGEGQEGKSGQDGQQGENGRGQQEGMEGKKGQGKGQNEGGQGGQGQGGLSEQNLQELYEIYKEQQMIRERLENQLRDMIQKSDQQLARRLIQQMENFENDLIENGITRRTLSRMNNIRHQLLKLENAALKQGKKEQRESETNRKEFQNPITSKPPALEEYRNEIEILNRQDLPLLQIYRNKVKQYFQKDD